MTRTPAGRRGGKPVTLVPRKLIVAVPAWGDRCVAVAREYTLPALYEALRGLSCAVEIMIWTDQPDMIQRRPDHRAAPAAGGGGLGNLAVSGLLPVVSMHPVPPPDWAFESLSNCHRQALTAAAPHDWVLLLTSDMVVSREIIATCVAQLVAGKKLVCCVAPRALQDEGCPVGAPGAELMGWAWEHRHPMTRECTWPTGRSYDIWRMYFDQGDGEVAARVFLPHPLACAPCGRPLHFRPTIDVNLCANFSRAETHLITSPSEGAVVELSPPDKEFLLTTTMRERYDAGGPSCPQLIRATNPRHRMFFEKRVLIRGAGGDCGDGEVVGRVLG